MYDLLLVVNELYLIPFPRYSTVKSKTTPFSERSIGTPSNFIVKQFAHKPKTFRYFSVFCHNLYVTDRDRRQTDRRDNKTQR